MRDNVHMCVSGGASHVVKNPTGLHNMQHSNAEKQPGSCGGESETLGCAGGIVGSGSQILKTTFSTTSVVQTV